MLPLDADNRPLRPAILYGIDTRAADEIAELNHAAGRGSHFARTGHELSAQSVGPKVLWYRKHQPELFRKTSKIVTASTYLVFRLTDRFVVDNYTAPYFTPFFDVQQLAWRRDWVEQVCPLEWLPETAWSAEQAGLVTREASTETGIPMGTPVAVGTADALAEAVAAGAMANGDLMVMYGTTLFLIQTTAAYRAQREALGLRAFAAGRGDSGGGHVDIGRAAGLVSRRAGRGMNAPMRRSAARMPSRCLAERAAATAPGAEGLITLPISAANARPSMIRMREASSSG